MYKPFFPDPAFGWTFCTVLLSLLAAAAYTDWRRMIVPKALTLTALPLGLLFNLVRGWALAGRGEAVWALGAHGSFVGALDGLLFALAGFAAAFGLFFLLWVLGVCGGGDVKLFAALGAWTGASLALWVLVGTLVLLIFLLVGYLAVGLAGGKVTLMRGRAPAGKKVRRRQRLLTYSLPLAVVTALVLLWTQRVDLRLAPPPPAPEVTAHAR
jgi:prepilin peptidase CpaA